MWFKRKQKCESAIAMNRIKTEILDEIENKIMNTPKHKSIDLGPDLYIAPLFADSINDNDWYIGIGYKKVNVQYVESFCSKKAFRKMKYAIELKKEYRPQWLYYLIQKHNKEANEIMKEKLFNKWIEKNGTLI